MADYTGVAHYGWLDVSVIRALHIDIVELGIYNPRTSYLHQMSELKSKYSNLW